MPVSADDAVNAHLPTPLFKREHEAVNEHGDGQEHDGNHDDVVENLDEAEEDVEEENRSADNIGVVEFNLLIGVRTVLHVGSQRLEPIGCVSSGRGGQLSAVNRDPEVHVVVIHQGGSLFFGQDLPRGEDGVEGQGWVAKGPRFVDAHHGQIFHRHPHAAVDHLVVFRRDFTRTVVFRYRSFEDGGFVNNVGKGEGIKHVPDVGLSFTGDG